MSQPPFSPSPTGQPHPPQWDPRRPFSAPPPSASIEAYKPPRSKSPIIFGVLVIIVFGVLAWVLLRPGTAPSAAEQSSASRAKATQAFEPSVPAGNAVPLDSRVLDIRGYWLIKDAQWTPDGLVITSQVFLESGQLSYSFFALDHVSTGVSFPVEPTAPSTETPGFVSAGETKTDIFTLDKERGDTMVVIADSTGTQITALSVKG